MSEGYFSLATAYEIALEELGVESLLSADLTKKLGRILMKLSGADPMSCSRTIACEAVVDFAK